MGDARLGRARVRGGVRVLAHTTRSVAFRSGLG